MDRREFFKFNASALTAGVMPVGYPSASTAAESVSGPSKNEMRVDGAVIELESDRLHARFDGPVLVRLTGPDGAALLERDSASAVPGLELAFANGDIEPIGAGEHARLSVHSIDTNVVHVVIEDRAGDACLRIRLDEQGRLLVEPAAWTRRTGLMGVRWNLGGIPVSAKLVAPIYQGCRLDIEHPLIAPSSRPWPRLWEAGIAILETARHAWSVAARDACATPKRLEIGHGDDPRCLGFQTENHAPWDMATSVGSLEWVIDVFAGDWTRPAAAYRDWLRSTYDYDALRRLRPDWVDDIRLTLQWQPNTPEVLDAVAEKIHPGHVLVHARNWRIDDYDVNYPEYTASSEGRAFVRHAVAKGFRVMPHFNYWGLDPNHSEYRRFADYVIREGGTGRLQGWRSAGGRLAFPQGPGQLHGRKDDETLFAYVHAGSSAWRRMMEQRISAALSDLGADAILLDQTFAAINADNGSIENLSVISGAVKLVREITEWDDGIAVCGEGLNELTALYQSFSQTHLLGSVHSNHELLHELDAVPVGQFLYGELCRSIGYNALNDRTPDVLLRMDAHRKLGAVPTLTHIRGAAEIRSPGAAVRSALAQALD